MDHDRLWFWGIGLASYQLRDNARPITLLDERSMWGGAFLVGGDVADERAVFLSSNLATGSPGIPRGLLVVDVSDPSRPTIQGQLDLDSVGDGFVHITGGQSWLAWSSLASAVTIAVVDLGEAGRKPQEIALEPLGSSGLDFLAVSGDRAWLNRRAAGIDEILLVDAPPPTVTPPPSATPRATATATATATAPATATQEDRSMPPILLPYTRR